MIYSNFYWHLKEVYDLFSIEYEVPSISFFESVQNFRELGSFGRHTPFTFEVFCTWSTFRGVSMKHV